MDFFLFFVLLISFIFLILGFIKPSLGLFWFKGIPTRKKVLLVYGLTFLVSFILFGVSAPVLEKKTPTDKTSSVKPNKEAPQKLNEQDLITQYSEQWNSASLTYDGDFPLYKDYAKSLDDILASMDVQIKSDSLPNFRKLYVQWMKSKKYSEALINFLTFGQPNETDLKYTCESYINENANDPESIDIVESKIIGRRKQGWEVWVKYRGRNGFGGMILTVTKFEVRHSGNGNFYVHRAY